MTREDELTVRDRAAFLLTLVCAYRRKRAVDGMNGRMWDGSVHLSAEREIDMLEAQWLTVRESTSTPVAAAEPEACPWCKSTRIMTWLSWPGLWGCYDCLYRWRQGDADVPSKECSRDHPAWTARATAPAEERTANDK